MIEFEIEQLQQNKTIACIKVIGIGGAGGNTVNSIINSGYKDIEFVVVNSDAQALEHSQAKQKIQIGVKSTKGLGTGADPELGKRAAEEDLDKVMDAVSDADIVFLAAGMGGGTGSGALPVIARALKEKGILSIAIITKPFLFEGKRRTRIADETINKLKQEVDTLIVIPNQKLLEIVDKQVSMIDGFAMVNDVLTQSVRGISDIITKPGHINVDFADVRTIMKDRGLAVMGTGRASGKDRAQEAALQAITSPLLENMNVAGAHGVLLNISGGNTLGLHEISEAASIIYEQAHEDANIIIGSVVDESLTDEVVVTIIATGFVQEKAIASPTEIPIQVRATVVDREQQVAEKITLQQPSEAIAAPQEKVTIPDPECYEEQKATVNQGDVCELKKEQKTLEKQNHSELIDQNDLDVPAFLRHALARKDTNN